MSATDKKAGQPNGLGGDVVLIGAGIGLLAGAIAGANLGVRADDLIGGPTDPVASNPFTVPFELASGDLAWSTQATVLVAAAVVLVVGAWLLWRLRPRKVRRRVDRAARFMAPSSQYADLLEVAALAKSERLGVPGCPGIPIGRTLSGKTLYMSFEDVSVDIWGPRTGKTTSRAVPAILNAPGAVLATSNKRDIVDGTRGVREDVGRVWVFDPQEIVGEKPTWWWNPLTYVVDEVKAEHLADVFIASNTDPGAKKDAYFDSAGKQLFTQLILAAACADLPITQIYLWLSDHEKAREAVAILYEHDYPLLAEGLLGTLGFSDKQRSGLFGTAINYCSFLTNKDAMRWVTPEGDRDRRPHFDPMAFVAEDEHHETLYSISKEGNGSTGALVTALTVAVCEAAEKLASKSRRGRLPAPMVAVLDEAANVCRWRELPNLYSHYGSRGICILTILQSWSQGVDVWGDSGMKKLWSAANVKVYGGGVSEVEFLEQVSKLVGDYELTQKSSSKAYGSSRSISLSSRRDSLLDVADLAALDRGRIVVFSSGNAALLAATAPWFEDKNLRPAVEASLAKYEPGREPAPELAAAAENPWLAA